MTMLCRCNNCAKTIEAVEYGDHGYEITPTPTNWFSRAHSDSEWERIHKDFPNEPRYFHLCSVRCMAEYCTKFGIEVNQTCQCETCLEIRKAMKNLIQ